MAKLKIKGKQLEGSVLALVVDGKNIPIAKLGAVEYTSEKGNKSITHLKSANYMGDMIATTEDNVAIVFKGMIFSKAVKEQGIDIAVGQYL